PPSIKIFKKQIMSADTNPALTQLLVLLLYINNKKIIVINRFGISEKFKFILLNSVSNGEIQSASALF
ncbi:MAG: hypothetical protein K2J25_05775, partial [Oscillospiraceae bacterium]|nr:hypothetical protein [Oscillospiraceae bacterium]